MTILASEKNIFSQNFNSFIKSKRDIICMITFFYDCNDIKLYIVSDTLIHLIENETIVNFVYFYSKIILKN